MVIIAQPDPLPRKGRCAPAEPRPWGARHRLGQGAQSGGAFLGHIFNRKWAAVVRIPSLRIEQFFVPKGIDEDEMQMWLVLRLFAELQLPDGVVAEVD